MIDKGWRLLVILIALHLFQLYITVWVYVHMCLYPCFLGQGRIASISDRHINWSGYMRLGESVKAYKHPWLNATCNSHVPREMKFCLMTTGMFLFLLPMDMWLLSWNPVIRIPPWVVYMEETVGVGLTQSLLGSLIAAVFSTQWSCVIMESGY